jgi:hypothetical protein
MEIYARTGAELIIQPIDQYYLRKAKKERCPIKFEKIVKVETDIFPKSKNILFGMEMPRDDEFSDVNYSIIQSE